MLICRCNMKAFGIGTHIYFMKCKGYLFDQVKLILQIFYFELDKLRERYT